MRERGGSCGADERVNTAAVRFARRVDTDADAASATDLHEMTDILTVGQDLR